MNQVPQSPAARAAREEANLGLPLGPSVRLRLAKRGLYRISWVFLKHQVAYNNHVLDALSEAIAEIAKEQIKLRDELSSALDMGVRQCLREVGDHIARTETQLARLSHQIAQLRPQ